MGILLWLYLNSKPKKLFHKIFFKMLVTLKRGSTRIYSLSKYWPEQRSRTSYYTSQSQPPVNHYPSCPLWDIMKAMFDLIESKVRETIFRGLYQVSRSRMHVYHLTLILPEVFRFALRNTHKLQRLSFYLAR